MKYPQSRFFPHDIRDLWLPQKDMDVVAFNLLAHHNDHRPKILTYTSKATLDTTESTGWIAPRDFQIVSIQLNVAGAPSGAALVWNVYVDGVTIFSDNNERPRIADGATKGFPTYPSRGYLPEGSKLSFIGVTLSSATGPLVASVQLEDG